MNSPLIIIIYIVMFSENCSIRVYKLYHFQTNLYRFFNNSVIVSFVL